MSEANRRRVLIRAGENQKKSAHGKSRGTSLAEGNGAGLVKMCLYRDQSFVPKVLSECAL